MSARIGWSQEIDTAILRMRSDGTSWEEIAAAVGLNRNTTEARWRKLSAQMRAATPAEEPPEPTPLDRAFYPPSPLPANCALARAILAGAPKC